MFGLVEKALRDRKQEHIPLAFAVIGTVYFLVIVAVAGIPLLCIFNGVPLTSWPTVYAKAAIVLTPISVASCAMAGLFGYLAYSRLSMLAGAAIFGVVLAVAVLGSLSVSGAILHGDVLRGIGTFEGIRNLAMVIAMLGSLGAALYWTYCRKLERGK